MASVVATACGSGGGQGTSGASTPSAALPPATIAGTDDATFIVKFQSSGRGPRLAVKDLIDIGGVVTTAGSAAVAQSAVPAVRDAACLEGARAADAQLVGKTNLSELAFDPTGIVAAFGIPTNPLDASLIPGGSSSGSAVAVATGRADIAYGTDTAGSIRIPAACCGVAGLKTTFGRIPVDGVYPLSRSLDVVGPIARDVAGLTAGMQLLEPSFTVADSTPRTVGRTRNLLAGLSIDPAIDAAVDTALATSGLQVVDVDLQASTEVIRAYQVVLYGEGGRANQSLLDRRDLLQPTTIQSIEKGLAYSDDDLANAQAVLDTWATTVADVFQRVDVLAMPTLATFPPSRELAASDAMQTLIVAALTFAWNAAGVPALALPIPHKPLPASLQLVGPKDRDELLLATGAKVEAAIRSS